MNYEQQKERLRKLLNRNCRENESESCMMNGCAVCEAEYLLRHGVIVFPVQVGQTVYFVLGASILTYHVDIIEIQRGYIYLSLRNWEYDEKHRSLGLFETSIGQTLFLTKGEAEEALKRRLKENEHR